MPRLPRAAVDRAPAILQFIRGIELLAAQAVEATIGAAVDVASAVAGAPQLRDAGSVAVLATGADEVVRRQGQGSAQRGESEGRKGNKNWQHD